MGLRKPKSIKHHGKRVAEILEAHERFFRGQEGGVRADLSGADLSRADLGGANLSGGSGTAFGAAIGAALIEVIRNSLLLLGVDAFWQGTFVGSFIVLAVMFDKFKGSLTE